MKFRTAWIVGLGSFSDYYVECVCETAPLAEAIAEALGGRTHEVAIYRSMPKIVDNMLLQANVTADGEVIGQPGWYTGDADRKPIRDPYERHERLIADPADKHQVPCRHDVHAVHDYTGKREWSVEVTVSGIDHERVRKVFSEQMAQAKADAAIIIAAAQAEDAEHRARG